MASNTKRICYTCGRQYRYCPHCEEFNGLPTWMNMVCSEECHDIFNACAQYNIGKITKYQARKILEQYNCADQHFYNDHINDTIAKIMESDTVAVDVVEEAVEEVVEETIEEAEAVATEDITETVETVVAEPDTDTTVDEAVITSNTETTAKTSTKKRSSKKQNTEIE